MMTTVSQREIPKAYLTLLFKTPLRIGKVKPTYKIEKKLMV